MKKNYFLTPLFLLLFGLSSAFAQQNSTNNPSKSEVSQSQSQRQSSTNADGSVSSQRQIQNSTGSHQAQGTGKNKAEADYKVSQELHRKAAAKKSKKPQSQPN